jgi:hypothetical protein
VTPGTQCQQPVSGCGWGWDDDLGTVDAAEVGMMTWARWARSARGLRCMGAHAGMMGGGGGGKWLGGQVQTIMGCGSKWPVLLGQVGHTDPAGWAQLSFSNHFSKYSNTCS